MFCVASKPHFVIITIYEVRFLRMTGRTAGSCVDVVVDRPDPRMSAAAQAEARVRVRSPKGWTSARGCATVRNKKRTKYIEGVLWSVGKAMAGWHGAVQSPEDFVGQLMSITRRWRMMSDCQNRHSIVY